MVTCKDAVINAVIRLGKVASTREVIDQIYKSYPDKPWKEASIRCHLIGLSVNHPSSKHYPTLHKQACLVCVDKGKFRYHNAEKDSIETPPDDNDSFESIGDEETSEVVISLERDLEEYIIRDLTQIEGGLELYSRKDLTGRQFNTDVGRIDILAIDQNGNFVVIELKAGTAKSPVVGQILSYVSWVRQNLAKGGEVRGIIIADDFDKKLKYASAETSNISLKKYEANFTFRDIDNESK